MDYVYGELNEKVEQNLYSGVQSSTSQVIVDNTNNTIRVDVLSAGEPFVRAIDNRLARLQHQDVPQSQFVVTAVNQNNGEIDVKKKRLQITDVQNLEQTLNNKQATLKFEGTYSSERNRVVTREYLEDAISQLSRAMFFVGISTTDPRTNVVTVDGEIVTPVNGFVTVYNSGEYIYYQSKWWEIGDETKYLIKNSQSISDRDIADEKISVVKIKGLTRILTNVQERISELSKRPASEINIEEHALDLLQYT